MTGITNMAPYHLIDREEMMTTYVFEYLHAMCASEDCAPDIEHEGFAMLERLVHDLSMLRDNNVKIVLHESRRDLQLPHEIVWKSEDWSFADLLDRTETNACWQVIAPEFDGCLSHICHELTLRGISYHGLPVSLIDLFADKLQSYDTIGSPLLETVDDPSKLSDVSMIVAKPRFGCGSLHVGVSSSENISSLIDRIREQGFASPLVFQPWEEGDAVSMAVIGLGEKGFITLPLADQHIVRKIDGSFQWLHYQGGKIPSARDADTVRLMIENFVGRLPSFQGYVGFDLIIPPRGLPVIIEVNPRFTLSYVGYSHGVERWTGNRDAFARLLLGLDQKQPRVGTPVRFNSTGEIIS